MKILILLFVAGFSILGNLHSQTCGYEHYTKYLEEKYPEFSETVKQTFKNVKSVPKHKSPNVIYRVPVVFHIVHENEQEDFADDLIYDQIVVLNEDFRMMNANSADTRDIFKEFAADVGIEFYLADTDPDGNPTTGITRTETNVTSFFGNDLDRVKQGDMGGKDAWDTDKYLNIWTCDLSLDFTMGEPVFYGFAFPPNGLSNWPTSLFAPDEYEGVVLHYQVVGRNHPGASENLLELTSAGRTLTHEVGHYLGLPHIWGNGDCNFDDGFNDTPTAAIESSPTVDAPIPCDHNHTKDTCDTDDFPDMVENFMDCNKQDCQTMFTQEQADFMVQVLTGPRASLIENSISSGTTWYSDVDGDTYGDDNDTVIDCEQPNGYVNRGGDCDDTNETVYPNAEELCDDLDNDCNSIIDDGLPFITVFEDKDDDGYGDLETEAFDCEVKAGFVENGDDCDDMDPDINPNTKELCDDVDNNCDGQVDEGLAQNTFYADNDGDGYGDTDSIIESCNMSIQGYVTNGDDCDDANPNPAAFCDDGTCYSCTDGIKNGNETGIDCGGSDCSPCECEYTYSFTTEPICSGDAPYLTIDANCQIDIGALDLDLYVYVNADGQISQAPTGFNPLEGLNGESITFPLVTESIQYLGTGTGNWYNSPACSSVEVNDFLFVNQSDEAIVITIYAIPWHYTNGLEGYSNIDSAACDIDEIELIINPESSCIEDCTDIIPLKAGWNLISLDVTPYEPSIESILNLLSPNNLQFAVGFENGAIFYDPELSSFLNTLTTFDDGYGYWIKLNNADTLEVAGTCLSATFKRDFDAGWNLIAYPTQMPSTPTDYFADEIANNNLIYIAGYDDGIIFFDPTLPSFLNTLDFLRNGFGYWIKLNNAAANKKGRGFDTNVFSFISGTSNLPEGAIIDIQTANGEKVGKMEVVQDGSLSITPIYGDDLLTPNKQEGLTIDETLYFKYNGQLSEVNTVFRGDMSLEKVELIFNETASFTIHPNPNKGAFQIELEKPLLNGLVEVTDASGKVHYQNLVTNSSSIFKLNLPQIKPGIYFVKVTDEDSIGIKKVVVH